jgi:hypothetical protein
MSKDEFIVQLFYKDDPEKKPLSNDTYEFHQIPRIGEYVAIVQ